MSTVLVTGASGFIGKALAQSLAEEHNVICMSRKDPGLGLPFVKGEFQSFEDLRQLDGETVDIVVHLGAVTGGAPERDGILVNVEGTRCLMRYLVDRGCTKFVMASSIAAMGIQGVNCRPLQLPIPDEHPCTDYNGYGVSKYLMEEVTRYFLRQNPGLDVINLRLSSVCPDDAMPPLREPGSLTEWALGSITVMALSDAVRVFTLAAEAPCTPGVRIMNACGPKAWVKEPTADVLRSWYGDGLDLSHYERPGHEYDSPYNVSRIKEQLGFEARVLPNP